MKIKIIGGATDFHMISLNDMKKIAESLQKIAYNFEYELYGTKNKDIFIKATKEGSFEIFLELFNNPSIKPIAEGLASAFLYDLIKKMKIYISSDSYRNDLKRLIDITYEIALELADEEYFDVMFEKKKKTVEKNLKLINAELSNFSSMKQISSIIGISEEETIKPVSICFTASNDEKMEVLEIDHNTKKILAKNELRNIQVNNIVISGVPDTLSRSNNSFHMEVSFIGKMKVRTTDAQLSKVSDYFKEKKSIIIEVEPIFKMGELVETRDAKLIRIIED